MKRTLTILFLAACVNVYAQQNTLPTWTDKLNSYATTDWLVNSITVNAEIYQTSDKKDIVLFNGLVKRVFRIAPNIACIDYTNMTNGQQLLRAIKPEGRITIDGHNYNVGGLAGQKEKAYLLPEWVDNYEVGKNDFLYTGYSISSITPFVNWKPKTWYPNTKNPSGKAFTLHFKSPLAELKGLEVNSTLSQQLY